MGKIVTRYNFETNSSSMHSLSVRRDSSPYSKEELMRSEAMVKSSPSCDAIITLKEGHVATEEEIREDGWVWDNRMSVWTHDLEMIESAMQVLSSFRDIMVYALATAYGY